MFRWNRFRLQTRHAYSAIWRSNMLTLDRQVILSFIMIELLGTVLLLLAVTIFVYTKRRFVRKSLTGCNVLVRCKMPNYWLHFDREFSIFPLTSADHQRWLGSFARVSRTTIHKAWLPSHFTAHKLKRRRSEHRSAHFKWHTDDLL